MKPLYPLITIVCLAVLGTSALAEETAIQLNIPPQPLGAALDALAKQSGLQPLYTDASVQGLKSPGVMGPYTLPEAVEKLLTGTGLTYNFTGTHAVAIKKPERVAANDSAEAAPKKKGSDEPVALPEMTVTASPGQDTSYNPPNATTATKTDTPIMETPVNIQVIPQQVFRDQQVIRIDKALENVSGVGKTRGPLASNFNVRGFDADRYRNGIQVRTNLTSQPFAETANLERIEVLKGPAAILFGRIEPGGLINLVTKQPLATPYYALEQQFGSFDLYRTTLDATGPLTQDDTLGYRFNLAYENSGSFREFIETEERVFVNPVLRWKLSERSRADFYVEYTHSDDPFDAGIPPLGNRPAPIPRERNLGEPGETSEFDTTLIGFDWSHAFDDRWTLRHAFEAQLNRSSGSPRFAFLQPDPAQCSAQACPVDRALFDALRDDTDSYYTALNLTGKFATWGLAHTLLLGGDFWQQQNAGIFRFVFSVPPIDLFNPVHTGVPSDRLDTPDFLEVADQREEWYGFYVQDQVKLPFNVHLLAGFRYDDANLSFGNSKSDDSAVTPRFGLLWQPIPAVSLYGNYVEGFGANNGRDPSGTPLPPETAEQWEVGLKTELFDGRLTGTLAWFDLTKQNIATPDPDPARALVGFSVATGEARNRGLELDIAGELWPGVRAIASYAYIDSEITKDRQALFNDDLTEVIGFTDGNQGNRLRGVPRHGGSFWLTYEAEGGTLQGLRLGAGVVARSQQQGSDQNDFQLPGYATVNLLVGRSWKLGPSTLSLQLNVDNLLDKEYFDTGGSFIRSGFPGAPRTFLGSVRVEF